MRAAVHRIAETPDPYFDREKWRRFKAARCLDLTSDALLILLMMIEQADPQGSFQISDQALSTHTKLRPRTLTRAKRLLLDYREHGQRAVRVTRQGHYFATATGAPIRDVTRYQLDDLILRENATRQSG